MINSYDKINGGGQMAKARTNQDVWDEIFDNLILETEPPIQYIKDAIIVTKNGTRFKVSASDYAEILARERTLGAEQSDIQSCSLSIDFSRIKRDVNRYANKLISTVEDATAKDIATKPLKSDRKKSTTVTKKRKVD